MSQHKWRLATTEAGLAKGYLAYLGLPYPRSAFRDHSGRVPQGDGVEAVHGYLNDTWVFDDLTPAQLQVLEGVVEAARTAGTIYATLPRMDGNGQIGWVDVSGKAAPLDVQKRQDRFNARVAGVVTLRINNITIVNDWENVTA